VTGIPDIQSPLHKCVFHVSKDHGKLLGHLQELYMSSNNMELEIVSEFIHLGTMFQRTGSFKKNKVNLVEKASKAMYDILNKRRVHNLSVCCHLAPYNIKFGVEVFKLSNSLQNFTCTFSNITNPKSWFFQRGGYL
jgi:hypothetical protein